MTKTRLIVGLGNPGKDYEYTRHNIGFLVVRSLAKMLKGHFALSSLTNGLVAEARFKDQEINLLMPLTYMNHSGVAVKQIMDKKKIPPENLLVISDDFNLIFGQLRFRAKGSDGGHNGLGSVIYQLGTDQFARLRIGIGRPSQVGDLTDYVLDTFNKAEMKTVEECIKLAAEGCKAWVTQGIQKAMESLNRRKTNG